MRGLVIGAARSGAGKTTVTLALTCALRRRGVRVRVLKSGPDYIDPAFHEAASGAPCLNLDAWAMEGAALDKILQDAAAEAELVLIETAMGLFDGAEAPRGRTGAGADLAARWNLPVLLVLDVSGQSQTAAAVARGIASHDPAVRVGGVVLNRTGSARHVAQVSAAMAASGIKVLGSIAREAAISLPERHLGLVQAGELATLPALLERLGALGESALDLDAVLAMAGTLPRLAHGAARRLAPPGQRIAMARDAAFSFLYPHLVADWRAQGAEIVPFSPLADEAPDAACDACWLPGGYPELHAGALAAAGRFRAGVAQFAQTRPVHGECGGFMVLGQALTDKDGVSHPMLGLLGHETSFARRRLQLGYRAARLLADCAIGRAGESVRGHEFHYATVTSAGPDEKLAEITDGAGRDLGPAGGRRGWVTGSFFHVIAACG